MAYPNETGRTAKSTGTTSYTEVQVTLNGDPALICIPATITDGTPAVLVICAHGHNGTEQTINGVMASTTRAMLDKGWIVASAYAHGNAWANNTALADYRRVHQWVNAIWPVTDTLLHGQSMGGLTMALAYSRGTIPSVRGMVGIDSALNLAAAHASGYTAAIRAAYGIAADGSDYATRTSGHDAVLIPPDRFAGKRLFLSASPADTAIPKVQHTDLFISRLGTHPAVLETRTGSGPHVDPANYFPADVVTFYEDALAAPVPVWPAPQPLPAGVERVEMFMDMGGQLVKLGFN